MKASDLLFEHYLAWQKQEGRPKSVKEFSEHIGIKYKNFDHFFSGRREPGEKIARQLAERFGDPRFYDAANMPRPDPVLDQINKAWPKLSDEKKRFIAEGSGIYTASEVPEENDTDPHR